jgi:hypothetical protein
MRVLITTLFLFFILVSNITSCARTATQINSFKDPAFTGKTFQRMVIIAPFAGIGSRKKVEQTTSVELAKHAVTGIPSMEIFLPTRTYTENDVLRILKENRIDSVLFLTLTDAYSQQVYIPGSSTTQGFGTLQGETINFFSTTYHSGGYYLSKPRLRFTMKLYDAETGKLAWIATSLTGGNVFAEFDDLINSLITTTIQKLQEDGVLQ